MDRISTNCGAFIVDRISTSYGAFIVDRVFFVDGINSGLRSANFKTYTFTGQLHMESHASLEWNATCWVSKFPRRLKLRSTKGNFVKTVYFSPN
jgi:hypothetical protein